MELCSNCIVYYILNHNFHIENIDFFTLLEDAVVSGEVGNTFESFEFVRDSNNEIVLSS